MTVNLNTFSFDRQAHLDLLVDDNTIKGEKTTNINAALIGEILFFKNTQI
jgi:hypothetical protein